jgi:hypothetical protein
MADVFPFNVVVSIYTIQQALKGEMADELEIR